MTKSTTVNAAPEQLISSLTEQLRYLKLPGIIEHYEAIVAKATEAQWSHVQFLTQLIELEATLRQQRAIERKIKSAKFPVIKTLQQFSFSWPNKINELQVKDIFRLQFMKNKTNIIFMGGVGLGKSHLATSLGHHSCLNGKSVLFINAIDAINDLIMAKKAGKLKHVLKKYLKPQLLILDELCKALHNSSYVKLNVM